MHDIPATTRSIRVGFFADNTDPVAAAGRIRGRAVVEDADGHRDAFGDSLVEGVEGGVGSESGLDTEVPQSLNLSPCVGTVSSLEHLFYVFIVSFRPRQGSRSQELAKHGARRRETSARSIAVVVSLGEIWDFQGGHVDSVAQMLLP